MGVASNAVGAAPGNGESIPMMKIYVRLLLCLSFTPAAALAEEYRYQGTCDVSAAAMIDDSHFIVGNDEDEILSVYTTDGSTTAATQSFNFASSLRSNIDQETDIEDATRSGDRIYWITSHGRSKKGKLRINRYRLFATDISHNSPALQLNWAGRYDQLVRDMLTSQAWDEPESRKTKETITMVAQATQLDKKTVDELDPKESGLNIEALAAMPDTQGLLIGFRNPLLHGKALVVHLKNPDALLDNSSNRASFSSPAYIDLHGLGLRSMEYDPVRKIYFIIAGPKGKGGPFKLFSWEGMQDPSPVFVQELQFAKNSFPEALLIHAQQIRILSDEGRRRINKRRCKSVNPSDRSFGERRYDLEIGSQ